MHPDDVSESFSFRQEEILATRYSVAYMCISNNSSPAQIYSAIDANIETSRIYYTVLLSKPFQKSKAKYNSEDEESEEVDDTDTVLKFEADEVAIFKRYKAFLAHGS